MVKSITFATYVFSDYAFFVVVVFGLKKNNMFFQFVRHNDEYQTFVVHN